MQTDKLKPCPFCGGEVILEKNELDCWVVRCTKCPLDFGRYWFAKKATSKKQIGTGGQTMRDRLIELLEDLDRTYDCFFIRCEQIADHLLANGVIVQKQGKWVIAGKDENDMCIFQCSNCARKQYGATFYCSTCGFEMINAKEREG